MERLALQFPGGVKVLLRNLRLKLGGLRLCDLHAVQRADHLDVALCGGVKNVRGNAAGTVAERVQRGLGLETRDEQLTLIQSDLHFEQKQNRLSSTPDDDHRSSSSS